MPLRKEEIARIAWLARLAISDRELGGFENDLGRILEMVATITGQDTTDIAPLAHPLDIPARLRRDIVTETDQREALQGCAPAVEEAHYAVPKVIKGTR